MNISKFQIYFTADGVRNRCSFWRPSYCGVIIIHGVNVMQFPGLLG